MACTITSVTVATATSVTINYTAYTGGLTFTRYGAQYSTDNGTTWLPATPTIFTANTTVTPITYNTSLTAGTTYVFRVAAYNSSTLVSGSASAASSAVTMVATPAAAPTVTGGNGSITLALAATLLGAATYTIQRDTAITFNTANLKSVSGVTVASSYVDDGSAMPFDAKGTAYFYRYRGVAANGTTGIVSSNNASAVAYATAPDAVVATTAIGASNTSVTVNWTALSAVSNPRTDGGASITAYKVDYSLDNSNWTTFTSAASGTSSTVNIGLTAGNSYYFRVSAINARGTGAASSSLQCSTLAAPPTIGASAYIVDANGNSTSGTSMNVSFTAPAGNAITGYKVTSGAITASGIVSPILVTGLTQGTSYAFTVQAITKNSSNADQLSAASTATAARTAATTPGNMGAITVGTRTTAATPLSWTAVAGNGLTTNYKIESTVGDGVNNVSWSTIVASQTAVSYAGGNLTPNNQYTWRITPSTSAGTGSASTVSAYTLPNASTTPVATVKAGVSDTVTITTATNVVANQKYRIIPYVGAVAQDGLNGTTDLRVVYISASAILMSQDISGLTVGTSYTFRTQAFNENGDLATISAASSAVVAGRVPGIPTGTLAASGQTSAAITLSGFAKPTDLGASLTGDITGYRFERSLNGTSWSLAVAGTSPSATSYTYSGLAANTGYWLRVAAYNPTGIGAWLYLGGDGTVAPASAPTGTLPTAPATPTATLTNNNNGSVSVSVTFTSVNGATYNVIPYSLGTVDISAQQVVASSTSTTVTFASLDDYTAYRFRVQYVGTFGNAISAYSNIVLPYTTATAPSGKTFYYYTPNNKEMYWLQYTTSEIANATFELSTTTDGLSAWKVTVDGQSDWLVGVRSVIFSGNAGGHRNSSPRAILYGGGSGNYDLEYSYASTWEPSSGIVNISQTGVALTDGSYLLFAAGETYTRTTPVSWKIDRAATIKAVGTVNGSSKATISLPTFTSNTWNVNYIASNITTENIIFDCGNVVRNTVVFKCSAENSFGTKSMMLLENIMFKNVDFINVGTKGLDFHYNKGITFDTCTIGEATNSTAIAFTSCKDVTIKNSTIACGGWGTFTFNTSDGPNYLWDTASSALAQAEGESQADLEARRLAALNNSNIDLTLNNSFPAPTGIYTKNTNKIPVIEVTLFRNVSSGLPNAGQTANLKNRADSTSHYQVSLPYSELKLPAGKFMIEYAVPLSNGFNESYKYIADSAKYSNTSTLRSAQFGTGNVIVTDRSTNTRIYPVAYELVPGTPVVAATAGDKSVVLSWPAVTAYADAGMDASDAYTVSVSPPVGTVTLAQDKLSATVSGLTNGTAYTFTVTAKNAGGLTSTSSSVSATPAKLPGAPTGLVMTPHDTSISVSCSNPADTGANRVAGYRVRVYTDAAGNNELTGKMVTDASTNPISIVDLSDGVNYYFSMAVKNDVLAGYGPESVIAGPQQTVTSPGAPSNVSAAAGPNSIDVSWGVPDVSGGNTSFTYVVRHIVDGVSTDVPVSGTSTTLSGLQAGKVYTVMVRAIGNIDTAPGAFNVPIPSVTPYSEPDAPATPAVTSRSSSSISLSWSAPANNGSTIISYRLEKSLNGSAWSDICEGNILMYTTSGLDANTAYQFRVYATNKDAGESGASSALIASTLAGKPTITGVAGARRDVILSFAAPDISSGITEYGIKVGGSVIGTHFTSPASFTVDGSDSPVAIKVYAITAAGNGNDSVAESVKLPLVAPGDVDTIKDLLSGPTPPNTVPYSKPNANSDEKPKDIPVVPAGSGTLDTAAPNNGDLLLVTSSNGQQLKDPKIAAKANDTDEASLKAALTAAKATGVRNIAVPYSGQLGTSDVEQTIVYEVKDICGDSISLNSNSASGSTVNTTVNVAGSTGLPPSGTLLMTVEPLTYNVNVVGAPAPQPTEGISIDFKVLDACGNVVSSGFSMPVTFHVEAKKGAVKIPMWHRGADGKYTRESMDAIEDPSGSGDFKFTFTHNQTYTAGSDPNPTVALCFLGNARVLTPAGYRRIDRMSVGDKVRTADGRVVAIQRVIAREYAPMRSTNPYVIPAGQFGAREEVLISPEHCVAVAGRGMVEARKLGLEQRAMTDPFTYYNLELPNAATDNMVVGGVEVESLANVRRIEITKAEFTALLKAKYGSITPDVIARATRVCYMTADGKVNMPVFKNQAAKK